MELFKLLIVIFIFIGVFLKNVMSIVSIWVIELVPAVELSCKGHCIKIIC